MSRLEHLNRFYELMVKLEDRLGGTRRLGECHGRMGWPKRGVYFFFEPGEFRTEGKTLRVVRVGTHALKRGVKATLWKRLRQHRGTMRGEMPGGGNHRGSIFRLHVGSAILRRDGLEIEYPSWRERHKIEKKVRKQEYQIEKKVSQHIRSMPFLWLKVDDPPVPESKRGFLEMNAIGLLSNYDRLDTLEGIDPPSYSWLGFHCSSKKVRASGLWNSNHVDKDYEPNFLKILECNIKKM